MARLIYATPTSLDGYIPDEAGNFRRGHACPERDDVGCRWLPRGTRSMCFRAWGYGAYERPGHYVVNVEADAYRSWTMADVEITADICHIRTVELTARLQPAR